MEMTSLLVHMKYTVCRLVHGNDIVTNAYEVHSCCYLQNIPDTRDILLG